MNAKRILGTVIFIGGFALIGFSVYLNARAAAGTIKIAGKEQQIEETPTPIGPVRKRIRERTKDQAQEKVGEAMETVSHFEELENWFLAGGIIFIVLGAGIFIFGRKKKP